MFEPALLGSGPDAVAPRQPKRPLFIRCDLTRAGAATSVPERNKFSQDETYFRWGVGWYAIGTRDQYEVMCFVLNDWSIEQGNFVT
jgi:hypothetical protein